MESGPFVLIESLDCFLQQVDKLGLMEQQASLYLQTKHLAEAENMYRKLLDYNPDNYLYVSRCPSLIHIVYIYTLSLYSTLFECST